MVKVLAEIHNTERPSAVKYKTPDEIHQALQD